MNALDHHQEWNDQLQDWLDGDLAPADQPLLETHLADCEQCQQRLQQLEALDRDLGAVATQASLDVTFDARVFARIDEIDEAQRNAARQRVQADIAKELHILATNWRRTLGIIIPGVIAGIALAFSLAAYFGTSELTQSLIAEGAAEIGSSTASFIHVLLTSAVGAAIGYVIARWLTPVAE